MSHDIDIGGGDGIMANKTLWLGIGVGVFILIGFILPTPESLVTIVKETVLGKGATAEQIAHASNKTMLVLGIIPMAVIFFATEAIPIGLTGILMPLLAYFLQLMPKAEIGKSFAGDAPMFLLGVLAMGVVVVDVGFHKRLAAWILGWTKGFFTPVIVLCVSMALIGSFISAHAMCAFMTPVIMAVYAGVVEANSKPGEYNHDPVLAKFLLFSLCFALNVGGVGSPAAGGRNVIMMGFWEGYNVPMDFFTWMKYGLPAVPALGAMVAIYMLVVFGRKIKYKDLTPGLKAIKDENAKMGSIKYGEWVTMAMLLIILVLWVQFSKVLGLGGPSLLALLIPVIFRVTKWEKIISGISWDAWLMYCGALTMGALLKESGAALWIAQQVLAMLTSMGISEGKGLWMGLNLFSGLMTNFMSDAGTTALLGPIIIPLSIMSGNAAEPWASGLSVAFATSFAHFLIVGTPNNAIVYGLGTFTDSGKRAIAPSDFVKYGFVLWLLSLVVVWLICFFGVWEMVGFPDDILLKAKTAMEAGVEIAPVSGGH